MKPTTSIFCATLALSGCTLIPRVVACPGQASVEPPRVEAPSPPPSPPPPPVETGIAPTRTPAPIKNIETKYQAASDEALKVAASKKVNIDTLEEMRVLYLDAGHALGALKKYQRASDYGAAREAVEALWDYVHQHDPDQTDEQ